MAKERVDVLLVAQGLFESREKAKAAIMAGVVMLNGERVDKPGDMLDPAVELTVKGNPIPFVSRGGLKLDKAVKSFQLNLKDKVCLDIGASTGGFTDCMLQNGARKVFAVDVGYGQLAWTLRQDERVIVMERTNFRYVTPEQLGDRVDFATADVSFISLRLILPAAKALMQPDARMMCLIKPQFEAGRDKVGKKGVIRDPGVHLEVVEAIVTFAQGIGFHVDALDFSPIRGPEGNIEYLCLLGLDPLVRGLEDPLSVAAQVVKNAHESF